MEKHNVLVVGEGGREFAIAKKLQQSPHVVEFGIEYAERVRRDHALFVEAFRAGRIGVAAT